jgi:hypothetical protein
LKAISDLIEERVDQQGKVEAPEALWEAVVKEMPDG